MPAKQTHTNTQHIFFNTDNTTISGVIILTSTVHQLVYILNYSSAHVNGQNCGHVCVFVYVGHFFNPVLMTCFYVMCFNTFVILFFSLFTLF